jgi:hypothetical protein
VYHACCVNTSQSAAIKVIDRDKSFKCGLVDQMSRDFGDEVGETFEYCPTI